MPRPDRLWIKYDNRSRHARGLPDPPNVVWRTTGGRCWYCGGRPPRGQRSLDHLLPLKRGGGNVTENIVPCCVACNRHKDRLTVEEYRAVCGGRVFFGERYVQERGIA